MNYPGLGRYYGWKVADDLSDLYQLSTITLQWINVTALMRGTCPFPRSSMGFTAGNDGKLYVFGGQSAAGGNAIFLRI